jgi:hypothetical protein
MPSMTARSTTRCVIQLVLFSTALTHWLQVKVLLKEFQNMNPADSNYVPKLEEIWTLLEHHIKGEESEDLPALEKALSSSENRGSSESLAKNFGRTKAFVPSRSHPSAGENPYLYVIFPYKPRLRLLLTYAPTTSEGPMGMLAAPIDHIADIFRKFPDGTVSPNPSKK